jgi:hypothetical protein
MLDVSKIARSRVQSYNFVILNYSEGISSFVDWEYLVIDLVGCFLLYTVLCIWVAPLALLMY